MGFLLWIILALLVAGFLVYFASLRTRRLLPEIELPDEEKLPRTPLQKNATWALVTVTSLTAIAGASIAGILLAYRRN